MDLYKEKSAYSIRYSILGIINHKQCTVFKVQ